MYMLAAPLASLVATLLQYNFSYWRRRHLILHSTANMVAYSFSVWREKVFSKFRVTVIDR